MGQSQTFQVPPSFLPLQQPPSVLPTITTLAPSMTLNNMQFSFNPNISTPMQVINEESGSSMAQTTNVNNFPQNVDILQSQPILPQVPYSDIFDPYSMKHMKQFPKEESTTITNSSDNDSDLSSCSFSSLTQLATIPSSSQEFIDVPYVEPLTAEHLYTFG